MIMPGIHPLIIEFIKSFGLDEKMVGDIQISMPVAGFVSAHIKMFVSNEQFEPLMKIAAQTPDALRRSAWLTLVNPETAAKLEVGPGITVKGMPPSDILTLLCDELGMDWDCREEGQIILTKRER